MPDELRQLAYDVREIGEGERILSGSIIERFTLTSSGALEPTKLVATTVAHAGICKVRRFKAFALLSGSAHGGRSCD